MAAWSGWFAAASIVLAALVPLGARVRLGKRAAPGSPTIRGHVALGLVTAVIAFLHTGVVLPALGSPAAVGGGTFALLAGALAFVVLVAHAGLGLKLRNPRLKDRARSRRNHVITGIVLATAVAAHAAMLLRAD